jgi:hypothetical protein
MESATENVIVDGHACTTGLLGMARSWHADVSQNGPVVEKEHEGLMYYLAMLLTQEDHPAADAVIHLLDAAEFHAAYERDTHRVTLACNGLSFTRVIDPDTACAYLMANPHIETH